MTEWDEEQEDKENFILFFILREDKIACIANELYGKCDIPKTLCKNEEKSLKKKCTTHNKLKRFPNIKSDGKRAKRKTKEIVRVTE